MSTRPTPDLAILETRVYRGANVWSYDKAIHLVVDLGQQHGQHRLRDVQLVEHSLVPLQFTDIVKKSTRSICVIGHMYLSPRHIVDQPCIHSAKSKLSFLRSLACTRYVVEYPLHFRSGEVGVNHQAGVLADV